MFTLFVVAGYTCAYMRMRVCMCVCMYTREGEKREHMIDLVCIIQRHSTHNSTSTTNKLRNEKHMHKHEYTRTHTHTVARDDTMRSRNSKFIVFF